MITIKLYHRSDGKDKSFGFIYVSFYVNREKVHFSTKVQCLIKHWSAEKMRISVADKNASDKNLILEKILSRINEVIVKYRLRNKVLTRIGFLKSYNRPDDFENFYVFVDEYKKNIVSKRVESTTLANHKTAIEKLKVFAPELHFDDINLEFIVSYYSQLIRVTKNNENTAYKNMSIIRKYVKQAYKFGYMDENPFDDFHILRTKPNYTFLEEEELKLLIKIYKSGELELKYYKTLQLFFFMCFGSQHIGDAKKMTMEQIESDRFTYWRMKTRNSKPELVTVPVSKSLRTLLTEIAGHRKKGLIFEKLPADQTMNDYLKKIAELAGVKKPISHKTGRHTFATFFLSKVPDLNSLKDILGHSDIRQIGRAHV